MKTIHKFPLVFSILTTATVPMSMNAKILCVQMQNEVITLWAEVDSTKPVEPRVFMKIGTGWALEDGHEYNEYVGTVQQGPFVWHIYETH